MLEHRPPALIADPVEEGGDPMPDPMHVDPERLRVVLDHGEVVELDGGTLLLEGQESPSVVLRMAPWRARSVARVLAEWSSVSRIFHHPARPHLDELELSRTLELAAAVLGGGDEPIVRSPRGTRVIPNRQRLAAVAVLGEREAQLSAVQRLALVDLGLLSTTGIEDAAMAVLDSLRRGVPYRRWLLIFDNADQPEDINDIVPRGPGHVLITSRNHRWQSVAETVLVNVFSRAESVAFLKKRVSNAISASDATRLAEELGDLPLALEQAGALQAETGMSVDAYLQLLKEQTSELLAENKPSEYPVSMTAAWKLSVSKLNEQLPEAVDLLRCCAFFGAEPIPRDVFIRTIQDVQPQLGGLLAKPILLTTAIRQFGRFALARIDPVSRTIQVHRLIQAMLREELSPEQQGLFRHDVHLLLAAAAPKNPDDNAQWPLYAELAAHVVPSGLDECQDPTVRRLALDIARYLYQSGDRPSSRTLLERLLDRWKADSGADHPEVLAAQWHWGNTLRDLGEYQAAYDLTQVTLERSREILGSRHELTLMLMNGFGADLRARGEFAEARDLDE